MVPAAGTGRRMGGALPKQYLPLLGQPVLAHTLDRLASHSRIQGLAVVTAPGDGYWRDLAYACDKPLMTAAGGAERCHSVLSGLHALRQWAAPEDWVLVHDAARPCLRHADIDRLLETLWDHPVGGLLGIRSINTKKRTDAAGNILETVDREQLWRALTPQMFRLGALTSALQSAIAGGALVTDEAAAMEAAGHQARMVEGHSDNIKITRPEDLALAGFYLQQQERM